MNGLIFSCLAAFTFLYQIPVRSVIKNGQIREGYCTLWIGRLIFTILGAILTLTMYRFSFLPLFSLRNLFFVTCFLLLTLLLVLVAPTGLSLFGKKNQTDTIHAEYHFNNTLDIIYNLFLLILFLFPIILALSARYPQALPFLTIYTDNQLCSTFCLILFLLLLPMCLRQSFFWLRNITGLPDETETNLLAMQKAKNYYKRRNIRL